MSATVKSSVVTTSEKPAPPIPAATVNPLPKSYDAATAESACPPTFDVPQSLNRSVNALYAQAPTLRSSTPTPSPAVTVMPPTGKV